MSAFRSTYGHVLSLIKMGATNFDFCYGLSSVSEPPHISCLTYQLTVKVCYPVFDELLQVLFVKYDTHLTQGEQATLDFSSFALSNVPLLSYKPTRPCFCKWCAPERQWNWRDQVRRFVEESDNLQQQWKPTDRCRWSRRHAGPAPSVPDKCHQLPDWEGSTACSSSSGTKAICTSRSKVSASKTVKSTHQKHQHQNDAKQPAIHTSPNFHLATTHQKYRFLKDMHIALFSELVSPWICPMLHSALRAA